MEQPQGKLAALIQALRALPGVGPKSAQRMAFHLLMRNREGGRRLGQTLLDAMTGIGYCESCRTLSEAPLCAVCASVRRDRSQLCVVESPADAHAIDQAGVYQGLYFVLHGRLSPLDGIGPEELGLPFLDQRLAEGEVQEMVLATNTTVEGEATAQYIAEMAHRHQVRATRIAFGIPMGGELEFVDSNTLTHAFSWRRDV